MSKCTITSVFVVVVVSVEREEWSAKGKSIENMNGKDVQSRLQFFFRTFEFKFKSVGVYAFIIVGRQCNLFTDRVSLKTLYLCLFSKPHKIAENSLMKFTRASRVRG